MLVVVRFRRYRFWVWLLVLGGSAGCRSQQVGFRFDPSPVVPQAATVVAAKPKPPQAQALNAACATPLVAPQQRAIGQPTTKLRSVNRLPVVSPVSYTRRAQRPLLAAHSSARQVVHATPAQSPGFTERGAYVLFTAVALLLLAGGILSLVFLSGWLSIGLGVLLLLGGAYFGLMAMFLGEFGTDEPFSFREFFFSKKPRK